MKTSLRWVGLAVGLLSASAWAGGSGKGAAAPASAPVDDVDGDLRGVTLEAGVGAEGYSGSLSNRIHVGPQWGFNVVFKPTTVLGIELGYSGSVDRFDASTLIGSSHTTGASVMRNGAQALLSVGLTASRVQPYLMAGVGWNHYSILGGATDSGYRSVSNFTLPVGIGLRTYFVGKFTLDARINYALSFAGDNFAGNVNGLSKTSLANLGNWSAGLYFGYTF